MKLVAYYSRGGENHFGGQKIYLEKGNTQKVAELIADKLGADTFKIEPLVPYSENYDECVREVVADFRNNARPKLKENLESIDKYDEIYLGYPNYCGDMPKVVYTFLESFDFTNKIIHPFCTHEGSGLANSVKGLESVCHSAIIKKPLALKGSLVDESRDAILDWLKEE